METVLTVTNLLLLLFWVRLWSLPDKELYFNPFLSAPTRLTDRVLDFLRPALPLPGRLTSLFLLAFLLILRGAALNHFRPAEPWSLTVGTLFSFSAREPGIHGALTFSALHFLFFVARFWGVYVLTQLLTPVLQRDRASEAFHFAALPLSALRRWLQILLLLTVHAILVYELTRIGSLTAHIPPAIDGRPFVAPDAHSTNGLLFLACLTLLSAADLLMMAWQFMFALLVGSFLAVMLQNALLNAICGEGIATLFGRSRKRLIVGFLDLTPLLYMASAYICYHILVLSVLPAIIMKIG